MVILFCHLLYILSQTMHGLSCIVHFQLIHARVLRIIPVFLKVLAAEVQIMHTFVT